MGRSREHRALAVTLAGVWTLSGAAYAQTPPPAPGNPESPPAGQPTPGTPGDTSPGRNSPDASGQPPPEEQGRNPGPETPEDPGAGQDTPDTAAAPQQPGDSSRLAMAGRAGVAAGMPVETTEGNPLGFVVDVVPGTTGTQEGGYVVIAGESGSTTPLPYSAASSLVRGQKLVIDHARFESAPKVQQSQIEDPSGDWRSRTDSYWSGAAASSHAGDHVRRAPSRSAPPDQPQSPQEQQPQPRN